MSPAEHSRQVNGRVLHLIDTGGPGGAETVFAKLSTGLPGLGWPSSAIVSRDAWLAERLREGGIEPSIMPARGSFNRAYLAALVRRIRSERPAVLLVHLMGPAVYGAAAGLWTRTPVIAVLHGQSDLSPTVRFLGVKSALIRRGCTRIVFVSDQLRDAVAPRLGLSSDRCTMIPNGVDVARYSAAAPAPLREELGLPADAILVGAVGNVRRPKGYDVLMRAARIAIDRDPRLHFVIAGDTSGDTYPAVDTLRNDLQLSSRVHFLGLRSDVPSVLRALDVFVLSSTTEGFSIACCEAMAAGIPVVATRSGGPEQILDDGRCGRLVPAGDAAALAEGLIATLRTPDEWRARVESARARVAREYGTDAMLRSYGELIRGVVGLTDTGI